MHDLRDVEYLDLLARLTRLLTSGDGVRQHRDAERAGRRHDVRIQLERLVDALDVDPLTDLLFHPHPRAAGATAEAAVLATVHFLGLDAWDTGKHLAWRGVDLVVAAEVAGVVVGDLAVDRCHRCESARLDQVAEQLGVVHDLVVAAQLRVLIRQRVEAVWAGRDDLSGALGAVLEYAVEGLDVLLRQTLEHQLIAEAAGRVAGAGLAGAHHAERDASQVEQLGDRAGDLLGAVLQCAGAADPE